MEQIWLFQSIACATSHQSSPLIFVWFTLLVLPQVQLWVSPYIPLALDNKWPNEGVEDSQEVMIGESARRRQEQGHTVPQAVEAASTKLSSPLSPQNDNPSAHGTLSQDKMSREAFEDEIPVEEEDESQDEADSMDVVIVPAVTPAPAPAPAAPP